MLQEAAFTAHTLLHICSDLLCVTTATKWLYLSTQTCIVKADKDAERKTHTVNSLWVEELAFSLKMDWIYFNQVYLQFRLVHMLKTTSAICTDGLWRSVHLQGRIDIIVKLSCGCRVGSRGSIAKYLAECQLILDLNCKKEECSSQTHTGAPV